MGGCTWELAEDMPVELQILPMIPPNKVAVAVSMDLTCLKEF